MRAKNPQIPQKDNRKRFHSIIQNQLKENRGKDGNNCERKQSIVSPQKASYNM